MDLNLASKVEKAQSREEKLSAFKDKKIISVAKYLLETHKKIAKQDVGSRISLQKLCYYSYAWFLVNFDKCMFKNDFKALNYGAFSPTLHLYQKNFDHNGYILDPENDFPEMLPELLPEEKETIENVVKHYWSYTTFTLVAINHMEDPWKNHAKNEQPDRENITDKEIKDFFGKYGKVSISEFYQNFLSKN